MRPGLLKCSILPLRIGEHGKDEKNQPDNLKQSAYDSNNIYMTQNTLFVNQMTQNTLFSDMLSKDFLGFSVKGGKGYPPFSPNVFGK